MSNWRLAQSLLTLRDEVNAAFPKRDRANDGTIGDAAHASRASDHNPWVDDGIVTALDITHDPANGCDCAKLVDHLCAGKDDRIKYIIWDGQIANSEPTNGAPPFGWRKYTGANRHDKHFHVSVKADRTHYDSKASWGIKPAPSAAPAQPATPPSTCNAAVAPKATSVELELSV